MDELSWRQPTEYLWLQFGIDEALVVMVLCSCLSTGANEENKQKTDLSSIAYLPRNKTNSCRKLNIVSMQQISRNSDKKIIYEHTVSSPTGREVLPLTDVCATIFQNSAGFKEAKIRGTFKDFSSTPIPPLHPA